MPHNVGVKVAATHLGQGVLEKSVVGRCDASHIRGQCCQTHGNGAEYSAWRGKLCHPERRSLVCLPPRYPTVDDARHVCEYSGGSGSQV